MCPRMTSLVKAATATGLDVTVAISGKNDQHFIGLYNADQVKSILTVGDGNFSYSLALARSLGPESGVRLVFSSHESKKTVLETYPDCNYILNELSAIKNVRVLYEVDATDAEQMKTLGKFDRVIWNFPCVRAPGGMDGQNREMEANKKLLNDFFAHVSQMLTPTGEVHVTHKTKMPFGQWGIEKIAKTNKLRHEQSIVFDRCLYPGYANKKVLSKESFPIWDSLTFIFLPEDRALGDASRLREGDKENYVVPITKDILTKLYVLLTPNLDDMLGLKKKKKGKKGTNCSNEIMSKYKRGSEHCQNGLRLNKGNGNKRMQASHGELKRGRRKISRRS